METRLEKAVIDEKIKDRLANLRIPKVFGISNRKDYAGNSDSMMDISNLDYHDIALKQINLYGKDVLIYPHVNLQARITMACDSQCGFCIERFDSQKVSELESGAYADRLKESLEVLQKQEVFPSVTITGGEPCLDFERLQEVIDTLKRMGVTKFNVNTNGSYIKSNPDLIELFKGKLPYLNISMHHWDRNLSSEIFNNSSSINLEDISLIKESLGGGNYNNVPRIRLQCVLLGDYVESIEDIETYLTKAREIGIDNVSFRGLSKLACGKYQDKKIVKMSDILDELGHSVINGQKSDWEFVCQNIADWYCYEDWKWGEKEGKWIDVHMNFSNMANLRRYETEERKDGKQYAREFVLFEDGTFSTGWNKDLGTLKK